MKSPQLFTVALLAVVGLSASCNVILGFDEDFGSIPADEGGSQSQGGQGGQDGQGEVPCVPVDDNNACTKDLCVNGAATHPAEPVGVSCSQNNGKVCDGTGACVECNASGDCDSGVCLDHACQAPTCDDNTKNGGETDVDCGGICSTCDNRMSCMVDGDCTINSCVNGHCQPPSCDDATTNGGETDVDCGGPDCATCAAGSACDIWDDCTDKVCINNVCQDVTCNDDTINGDETDTDCGGAVCPPCAIGSACSSANDCATEICLNNACSPKPPGSPCITGGECQDGFCADGVCCNSTCAGDCLACNLVGSEGVCSAVKGTIDAGTCEGTKACNANGLCKKLSGQACGSAAECLSNSCSDGYCCNTSCGGYCQECNLPGTEGTCTYVPLGMKDNDSCSYSNMACDGNGSCKDSNGEGCNSPDDCLSGFCVDYRCCDTECSGTCQACNLSGKDGLCSPVLLNQDAETCQNGSYCDANGQCKKSDGYACSAPGECHSGFCEDGVCCGSQCTGDCKACNLGGYLGQCQNVQSGLDAAACSGSALSCDGLGACKKENGETCGSSSECLSDICVDGVCCNAACTDVCYACNLPGSEGTCNVFPKYFDDTFPMCGGNSTCNGSGQCKSKNGQPCATEFECASQKCSALNVCAP